MKKYLFRNKALLIFSIFMSIIMATLNVLLAFIFKYIIDSSVNSSKLKFKYSIGIFIIYLVCIVIFGVLGVISKEIYIKKTMIDLKRDIFYKIIEKDIKSFDDENSGKYISILSNDMIMIKNDYFNNIFKIIKVSWGFILATISMFLLSKEITIAVIILSILMLIMPKIFGEKLSEKKLRYSNSLEIFTSKIKDAFNGFDVIKTFNVESKIKNEYDNWNSQAQDYDYRFNVYQSIIDVISMFVALNIFSVVLILGMYLVIREKIAIGTMLACVQLCNNVANPIAESVSIINNIKSLKSISCKVTDIMKSEKNEKVYTKKESFDSDIIIDKLTFEYDKNKKVLNNVNLKFEKGKKYAIVGASGCGKSTLLKIILKYYEDYEGNIKIDGKNLKNISTDNLYKIVTMIHQNVFIFDATLRENITLFGEYSEKEIEDAVNISGLKEVIEKLECKLESRLGENGKVLSGGEKQRLAIARAIIKKTPILFLDEATASLDNGTSYKIEKTILNMKNITGLVITHRLYEDILKEYDEIIVIKDGNIIEKGNFYNLINVKGYFYNLYRIA